MEFSSAKGFESNDGKCARIFNDIRVLCRPWVHRAILDFDGYGYTHQPDLPTRTCTRLRGKGFTSQTPSNTLHAIVCPPPPLGRVIVSAEGTARYTYIRIVAYISLNAPRVVLAGVDVFKQLTWSVTKDIASPCTTVESWCGNREKRDISVACALRSFWIFAH